MGYPVRLKESVLRQVLQGNKAQHEIAGEYGIGRSTIGKWLKDYRQKGNIQLNSQERRPKDWTAQERMTALIETGSMSAEERTGWCRKKGLFTHNLDQWKKEAIAGMSKVPGGKHSEEVKALKKENLSLKRDLTRKEKALAETAALLVLKKKAQEIWGEPEGE